jgi:hypothetical protein
MPVAYSTSWVEICNQALGRLGKDTIASLSEGTPLAKYCNLFLGQAIDELYSLWDWTCCRTRVTLNRLAATPDFGPAYFYQLPTDFVRPISVDSGLEDWSIESDRIATSAEVVTLIYLGHPVDPAKIPGYMKKAVSTRLALSLATPLTSSEVLTARLVREDKEAVDEAIAADSRRAQDPASVTWYGDAR